MDIRERTWQSRGKEYGLDQCFTASEWDSLCEHFGGICLACRQPGLALQPDHVTPLSRGGSNLISNIQPLCDTCNKSKGDRVKIDYRNSPEVIERYPNLAVHKKGPTTTIWNDPEIKARAQALADLRDISLNKWVREAIVEKIARSIA